jgi:hypothetical protein
MHAKFVIWLKFNENDYNLMPEILNLEYFLSLKIQLNNKKIVLKGEISWVTGTHLSQQLGYYTIAKLYDGFFFFLLYPLLTCSKTITLLVTKS